jgi:predicted esterase
MQTIKRPSIFLFLTEFFRAIVEHWRGNQFLKHYKPLVYGDGHPVLVVPGLLCTDFSTTILRGYLNKIGYTAYGWELGRNLGDLANLHDLKRLDDRVKQIRQKHAGQKITLIGWSMGGIYARELAKRNPALFRQVITIASPFADPYAPNNIEWFYKLIHHESEIDKEWREQVPVPAPIPTLCIYSKQDGVVPWAACREHIEDASHQHLEAFASHCGLGATPSVLQAIERQLASAESGSIHDLVFSSAVMSPNLA